MRNYSNKKLFGAFLVLGAMFFSATPQRKKPKCW